MSLVRNAAIHCRPNFFGHNFVILFQFFHELFAFMKLMAMLDKLQLLLPICTPPRCIVLICITNSITVFICIRSNAAHVIALITGLKLDAVITAFINWPKRGHAHLRSAIAVMISYWQHQTSSCAMSLLVLAITERDLSLLAAESAFSTQCQFHLLAILLHNYSTCSIWHLGFYSNRNDFLQMAFYWLASARFPALLLWELRAEYVPYHVPIYRCCP